MAEVCLRSSERLTSEPGWGGVGSVGSTLEIRSALRRNLFRPRSGAQDAQPLMSEHGSQTSNGKGLPSIE